jgi:CRISPR/Cas system-associated exonuclease Cas4 (RecB family)
MSELAAHVHIRINSILCFVRRPLYVLYVLYTREALRQSLQRGEWIVEVFHHFKDKVRLAYQRSP